MQKQEFRKMVENGIVYLDGATGTNLQKAGMPTGVCPEQWILEHPDVLLQLQKEYVAAGSNILYAPTFTANRVKLEEYGLYEQMPQMIRQLVAISLEAAGGKALVAGDITMTGRQLAPMGDLDFEELVEIYKEQITLLEAAGVDLLAVETMMSLQESRAALIAAKECSALPVMVTMTFEADGRTLYGTTAETAAVVLDRLGADAIGANCSTGPKEMAEMIRKMAAVTDKPLIGKPNAGLPQVDENGKTVFGMDSTEFADEMKLLTDAGAGIIGGCCGTTPQFISRLQQKQYTCVREPSSGKRYLTSERKLLAFGLNDPFMVVGERINPTGKKALQASIRSGSMDMVVGFAEDQEDAGAAVLDINMGMSGIDEKEKMLEAVGELSMATSLPLCIDSSHPEVVEAALRRYPGRALINSVSLESVKIEKMLPLAQKYGAMIILLPVSDAGLPATQEEKYANIRGVLEKAYALGLGREDIVVDGLVATVGADQNAALSTLDTIRYCKEQGLATICGLSNISFGLPQRKYINTAFLTMAIANGLTMAIANPQQEILRCAAFASDLLLHKEDSAMRYINFAQDLTEREQDQQPSAADQMLSPQNAEVSLSTELLQVYRDVMKGNKKQIVTHEEECLSAGVPAKSLLDDALLPAINEVGALFDAGTYFLPQLISSAEAMKTAIERIEPLLQTGSSAQDMPAVVMATVDGDVHDIGKNLVSMMLRNYGFRVIDLGKNVPRETIVDTAIEKGAEIIGLSALMTTTMQEMRRVIAYAREKGYSGKVMIGGAVVTQDYADEIGADGFSPDAAAAVKLADRLCGIKRT